MRLIDVPVVVTLSALQAMLVNCDGFPDPAKEPQAAMRDVGLPINGGGGGANPACIPACEISFTPGVNPFPDYGGCDTSKYASASFLGNCYQLGTRGSSGGSDGGAVEVVNCPGLKAKVLKNPNLDYALLVVEFQIDDGPITEYGDWVVSNCQVATPGGQCTYKGGGCDVEINTF